MPDAPTDSGSSASATPSDTSTSDTSTSTVEPAVPRGRWNTPRAVTVAALAFALTAPGQTPGLSVLVDPIIHELDVSRSAVSAAYMCGTLSGALVLPTIGSTIDKYGPRRVMVVVAIAFGAVLLLASLVSNLFGLALAFIGLRMTGQGALGLVATTAVALHVHRRRGLAQGITSAIGVGGISLSPVLLERLVADYGFRTVWLIEGLTIWAIAIPLAVFGLPKLARPARVRGRGMRSQVVTAPGDWTPREARRTAFFWVVAASIAAVAMLASGVNFHQIALLGERGLSPTEAAANFLPQTVAGLSATLIAGMLADRLPPRAIIVFCMLTLAFAVASGGYVHPGWSAFAFGAALGVAGNGLRVLEATAFPNMFGLSHVGAIRGGLVSTTIAASAFGPLLFALAHDWVDSYRPVLLVSAVFPIGVAVAAMFTRAPKPKRAS